MVNIYLENGSLVIDGADDQSIFDWTHRSFFTIASGFDVDLKSHKYISVDNSIIYETLSESINYLHEEGFTITTDNQVASLLKKISEDRNAYKQALESSRKLINFTGISHPSGMKRKLKNYQLRGFQHLVAVQNGANFSVPGSGKTSVIYAAFEKYKQDKIIQKLIVIGPRSCFQPWEDEAKVCFDTKIKIVRDNGPKKIRHSIYLNFDEVQVLLLTYQTATNDKNELLRLCEKYKIFIVIDESHNIKSIDTGTRADAIIEISRYATRRAILSGTPIPNNLLDLWSQITFLWPNKQILGDRISFKDKCDNPGNTLEVRKLVKPFIFRTTKNELGLPKPKFLYHYCDLKPYQQSIYKALSIKILNELKLEPEDRIIIRQWRKAKIVRLIQSASNPALLTKYSKEFDVPPLSGDGLSIVDLINGYNKYELPAKFEKAISLTKKLLGENKKVILWTTFVFNIQMLKELLSDFHPFVVYGDIPKDESEDVEFNREQQISGFKKNSGYSVLIANPAACAESISLHKICHDAVYVDRTFNCGQYLQSLDRIHRIGLLPNEIVNYHLILANGTIDETIDRRLKEKEKNMLQILDDELPVGSFDVDYQQMGKSEDEEKIDFNETILDIQKSIEPDTKKEGKDI